MSGLEDEIRENPLLNLKFFSSLIDPLIQLHSILQLNVYSTSCSNDQLTTNAFNLFNFLIKTHFYPVHRGLAKKLKAISIEEHLSSSSNSCSPEKIKFLALINCLYASIYAETSNAPGDYFLITCSLILVVYPLPVSCADALTCPFVLTRVFIFYFILLATLRVHKISCSLPTDFLIYLLGIDCSHSATQNREEYASCTNLLLPPPKGVMSRLLSAAEAYAENPVNVAEFLSFFVNEIEIMLSMQKQSNAKASEISKNKKNHDGGISEEHLLMFVEQISYYCIVRRLLRIYTVSSSTFPLSKCNGSQTQNISLSSFLKSTIEDSGDDFFDEALTECLLERLRVNILHSINNKDNETFKFDQHFQEKKMAKVTLPLKLEELIISFLTPLSFIFTYHIDELLYKLCLTQPSIRQEFELDFTYFSPPTQRCVFCLLCNNNFMKKNVWLVSAALLFALSLYVRGIPEKIENKTCFRDLCTDETASLLKKKNTGTFLPHLGGSNIAFFICKQNYIDCNCGGLDPNLKNSNLSLKASSNSVSDDNKTSAIESPVLLLLDQFGLFAAFMCQGNLSNIKTKGKGGKPSILVFSGCFFSKLSLVTETFTCRESIYNFKANSDFSVSFSVLFECQCEHSSKDLVYFSSSIPKLSLLAKTRIDRTFARSSCGAKRDGISDRVNTTNIYNVLNSDDIFDILKFTEQLLVYTGFYSKILENDKDQRSARFSINGFSSYEISSKALLSVLYQVSFIILLNLRQNALADKHSSYTFIFSLFPQNAPEQQQIMVLQVIAALSSRLYVLALLSSLFHRVEAFNWQVAFYLFNKNFEKTDFSSITSVLVADYLQFIHFVFIPAAKQCVLADIFDKSTDIAENNKKLISEARHLKYNNNEVSISVPPTLCQCSEQPKGDESVRVEYVTNVRGVRLTTAERLQAAHRGEQTFPVISEEAIDRKSAKTHTFNKNEKQNENKIKCSNTVNFTSPSLPHELLFIALNDLLFCSDVTGPLKNNVIKETFFGTASPFSDLSSPRTVIENTLCTAQLVLSVLPLLVTGQGRCAASSDYTAGFLSSIFIAAVEICSDETTKKELLGSFLKFENYGVSEDNSTEMTQTFRNESSNKFAFPLMFMRLVQSVNCLGLSEYFFSFLRCELTGSCLSAQESVIKQKAEYSTALKRYFNGTFTNEKLCDFFIKNNLLLSEEGGDNYENVVPPPGESIPRCIRSHMFYPYKRKAPAGTEPAFTQEQLQDKLNYFLELINGVLNILMISPMRLLTMRVLKTPSNAGELDVYVMNKSEVNQDFVQILQVPFSKQLANIVLHFEDCGFKNYSQNHINQSNLTKSEPSCSSTASSDLVFEISSFLQSQLQSSPCLSLVSCPKIWCKGHTVRSVPQAIANGDSRECSNKSEKVQVRQNRESAPAPHITSIKDSLQGISSNNNYSSQDLSKSSVVFNAQNLSEIQEIDKSFSCNSCGDENLQCNSNECISYRSLERPNLERETLQAAEMVAKPKNNIASLCTAKRKKQFNVLSELINWIYYYASFTFMKNTNNYCSIGNNSLERDGVTENEKKMGLNCKNSSVHSSCTPLYSVARDAATRRSSVLQINKVNELMEPCTLSYNSNKSLTKSVLLNTNESENNFLFRNVNIDDDKSESTASPCSCEVCTSSNNNKTTLETSKLEESVKLRSLYWGVISFALPIFLKNFVDKKGSVDGWENELVLLSSAISVIQQAQKLKSVVYNASILRERDDVALSKDMFKYKSRINKESSCNVSQKSCEKSGDCKCLLEDFTEGVKKQECHVKDKAIQFTTLSLLSTQCSDCSCSLLEYSSTYGKKLNFFFLIFNIAVRIQFTFIFSGFLRDIFIFIKTAQFSSSSFKKVDAVKNEKDKEKINDNELSNSSRDNTIFSKHAVAGESDYFISDHTTIKLTLTSYETDLSEHNVSEIEAEKVNIDLQRVFSEEFQNCFIQAICSEYSSFDKEKNEVGNNGYNKMTCLMKTFLKNEQSNLFSKNLMKSNNDILKNKKETRINEKTNYENNLNTTFINDVFHLDDVDLRDYLDPLFIIVLSPGVVQLVKDFVAIRESLKSFNACIDSLRLIGPIGNPVIFPEIIIRSLNYLCTLAKVDKKECTAFYRMQGGSFFSLINLSLFSLLSTKRFFHFATSSSLENEKSVANLDFLLKKTLSIPNLYSDDNQPRSQSTSTDKNRYSGEYYDFPQRRNDCISNSRSFDNKSLYLNRSSCNDPHLISSVRQNDGFIMNFGVENNKNNSPASYNAPSTRSAVAVLKQEVNGKRTASFTSVMQCIIPLSNHSKRSGNNVPNEASELHEEIDENNSRSEASTSVGLLASDINRHIGLFEYDPETNNIMLNKEEGVKIVTLSEEECKTSDREASKFPPSKTLRELNLPDRWDKKQLLQSSSALIVEYSSLIDSIKESLKSRTFQTWSKQRLNQLKDVSNTSSDTSSAFSKSHNSSKAGVKWELNLDREIEGSKTEFYRRFLNSYLSGGQFKGELQSKESQEVSKNKQSDTSAEEEKAFSLFYDSFARDSVIASIYTAVCRRNFKGKNKITTVSKERELRREASEVGDITEQRFIAIMALSSAIWDDVDALYEEFKEATCQTENSTNKWFPESSSPGKYCLSADIRRRLSDLGIDSNQVINPSRFTGEISVDDPVVPLHPRLIMNTLPWKHISNIRASETEDWLATLQAHPLVQDAFWRQRFPELVLQAKLDDESRGMEQIITNSPSSELKKKAAVATKKMASFPTILRVVKSEISSITGSKAEKHLKTLLKEENKANCCLNVKEPSSEVQEIVFRNEMLNAFSPLTPKALLVLLQTARSIVDEAYLPNQEMFKKTSFEHTVQADDEFVGLEEDPEELLRVVRSLAFCSNDNSRIATFKEKASHAPSRSLLHEFRSRFIRKIFINLIEQYCMEFAIQKFEASLPLHSKE